MDRPAALERLAREQPRRYRLELALLASLGYAVVLGALLAAVAVPIGVAAITVSVGTRQPGVWVAEAKFLAPFLLVIPLIVRAFWVRLPRPDGRELQPADAPELFALVEEVRAELQARHLDVVLVEGNVNASVALVPRLGVFGPYRGYLVLGLPLLELLSPAELRAVLAHELVHLSRRHGRFDAWVYRVRGTWVRVHEALRVARRWKVLSRVLSRFLAWYAPVLDQRASALRRTHEYEADAGAPDRADQAAALVRLELGARFVDERFWPGLWSRVRKEPEPPKPFSELIPALSGDVVTEAEPLDTASETHPALNSRLQALSIELTDALTRARAPHPERASNLLGSTRARLVGFLDDRWRGEMASYWREQHRAHLDDLARLASLDGAEADEPAALQERAGLTMRVHGDDAAEPLFAALLELDPSNAVVQYFFGRRLLERGDESGLKHLECAMEAEPDAIVASCAMAEGFLRERGRDAEADGYRKRLDERYGVLDEVHDTVRVLSVRDKLAAPDLPSEELSKLSQRLSSVRHLKRAYLVRKLITLDGKERSCYYLAIYYGLANPRRKKRLLRQLAEVSLPVSASIIDLTGTTRLDRRVRKVKGARVYRRRLLARLRPATASA